MRCALFSLSLLAAGLVYGQDTTLADTRWALVTIQSMDDSSLTPEGVASYTLAFNADHSVAIHSDCNQAAGTWVSQGPGQLQFSTLASTGALCPPGSLDEAFRAQFQWVRSYMMRNGHLFLATMADGSIVEFRPLDERPVVARLMGEDLHSDNPEEVQYLILTRLFDDYATRNGLVASDGEVAAYLAALDRGLRADLGEEYTSPADLPPEEAAEALQMREGMARSLIRQWKVNRALFSEYGGRLIYQQLGPEPLDAYRVFLLERQKAGDFELLDEAVGATFWSYFTDEQRHDFMNRADARSAYSREPWSSQADGVD